MSEETTTNMSENDEKGVEEKQPDETNETQNTSEVAAPSLEISQAVSLLSEAETLLSRARGLLKRFSPDSTLAVHPVITASLTEGATGTIIEGIFDGQKMIGPDGKPYTIPANYASKSKLVEGDLLKLTITDRGAFVYKQIGPIVRRRLRGVLVRNPALPNEWGVKINGRTYHVLTASVTYFRAHEGDEVIILVPENGESRWAAVENIMRAGEMQTTESPAETEDHIAGNDLDIH